MLSSRSRSSRMEVVPPTESWGQVLLVRQKAKLFGSKTFDANATRFDPVVAGTVENWWWSLLLF